MAVPETGSFLRGGERTIHDVPAIVKIILFMAFLSQLFFHAVTDRHSAKAEELYSPPPLAYMRTLSFSDEIVLSKIIMLWLQAFDNQPGISIPFRQLDYNKVIQWLSLVLELDPAGQYPLLMASRVYGEVADNSRKKLMLEFVYNRFFEDPNHRWPSLAHAVFVAKYKLKDFQLAFKYADALAGNVTAKNVPFWVKEMHIYVLEDMGELESAKVLIGGLLDSGSIEDEHEIRFLQDRVQQLEREENEQKNKAENN